MTEDEITAEVDRRAAEAVTAKEAELKAAQDELAKLKDKDFNFGKMKEGEKTLQEQIAALKTQIQEKETKEVSSKKSSLLDAFAGSNKELREKIEGAYGKLNMPEGSPEEIEARLKEAFTLATATRHDDRGFRAGSAASGGRVSVNTDEVDPDVSALAGNFGKNGYDLSAEDIKKFGKKK